MRKKPLEDYSLSTGETIKLWLENYGIGESLQDITSWTRFKAIDECLDNLVTLKEKESDELFRFHLVLDGYEEMELREYLSRRKKFALNYIWKRESFEPYTHLYQFYLQYLAYELNELEKILLLEGYLHMLEDLFGNDIRTKRMELEKNLNLKPKN